MLVTQSLALATVGQRLSLTHTMVGYFLPFAGLHLVLTCWVGRLKRGKDAAPSLQRVTLLILWECRIP